MLIPASVLIRGPLGVQADLGVASWSDVRCGVLRHGSGPGPPRPEGPRVRGLEESQLRGFSQVSLLESEGDLDEVRQLIEQSKDNGQTWTVTFDGTYKRKR